MYFMRVVNIPKYFQIRFQKRKKVITYDFSFEIFICTWNFELAACGTISNEQLLETFLRFKENAIYLKP